MVQRPKNIILEACPIWYEEESRWMQKRRMTSSTTSNLLLHLHCRIPAWLNICLLSSAIYRVDEDTDVLTEEQAVKHWAEFEMADFEELKQFHEQKVFVKVRIDEQPSDVVFVDATWVRKFKRNAPGSRSHSRPSQGFAPGVFLTLRNRSYRRGARRQPG